VLRSQQPPHVVVLTHGFAEHPPAASPLVHTHGRLAMHGFLAHSSAEHWALHDCVAHAVVSQHSAHPDCGIAKHDTCEPFEQRYGALTPQTGSLQTSALHALVHTPCALANVAATATAMTTVAMSFIVFLVDVLFWISLGE
jgi:hypothetical protein